MKKILFLLATMLLLNSCVSLTTSITTTTTMIGNVSAYNADGTILKEWKDIIIDETTTTNNVYTSTYSTNSSTQSDIFKSFGFNFYDPASKKHIIISDAVPCIIEYDVNKNSNTENFKNEDIFSYTNIGDENKKKLISEYKTLLNEHKDNKIKLKELDNDSEMYLTLKNRQKELSKQINKIKINFMNKYNTSIYEYF